MHIALKQILVPTDFSEPSGVALKYGKALAENFGAALHLLHVIEPAAMYAPTFFEGLMPITANVQDEMEKAARQRLATLLAAEEHPGLRAEASVLTGSPYIEIVRFAAERDIDLIVLGTHGRGPIAHMLLGGVAEKVVRNAPCPVLTVRHPEHEFVMP